LRGPGSRRQKREAVGQKGGRVYGRSAGIKELRGEVRIELETKNSAVKKAFGAKTRSFYKNGSGADEERRYAESLNRKGDNRKGQNRYQPAAYRGGNQTN